MAEYLKNPIVPSDKNVERFSFGTIIKQQLDLLNDSDI